MTSQDTKTNGFSKDVIVYVCLLALAGVQFLIAYQNIDIAHKLRHMLVVAFIQAGLAMMFFMHLWSEKRGFVVFVVVFTVAVLLGLQFGWTDSTRMLVGAPFTK